MPETPAKPLLEVTDLRVHYPLRGGLFGGRGVVRAVDGVSFSVPRGKTVGLVGESGSGKTTIGRALTRLAPITSGSIRYDGHELTSLAEHAFFPFRKRIQMIFQDPFNSLNPRLTIFQILSEPLEIHFPKKTFAEREQRVRQLLGLVGLEAGHLHRYPHEFSGGQRQRIGIARALAVEPDFLVCDEPVSALDVSVQAQIVNLLRDLQEQLGLTYLFIAHDLAVVEHVSDLVLVMTEGHIVEAADAESIYAHPQHDYTRKLLEAVPRL
jgi:peptide/nickel transport system ATP-binding protein/oligopeptide transport system ATP-binding protein